MSRSGYTDEFEDIGSANLYRANVARAIAGKRGQAFLREMATALDAMPVKELVADEVVRDSAHVCAMGAVALARKLDVSDLDVDNADEVARILGIAESLAREISYENDECSPMHENGPDGGWVRRPPETPAERWQRMRKWVGEQIRSQDPR